MSTQTTAYCLLAMSKFAGSDASSRELNFTYQFDDGRKTTANTKLSVVQVDLDTGIGSGGNITVDNSGEGQKLNNNYYNVSLKLVTDIDP